MQSKGVQGCPESPHSLNRHSRNWMICLNTHSIEEHIEALRGDGLLIKDRAGTWVLLNDTRKPLDQDDSHDVSTYLSKPKSRPVSYHNVLKWKPKET